MPLQRQAVLCAAAPRPCHSPALFRSDLPPQIVAQPSLCLDTPCHAVAFPFRVSPRLSEATPGFSLPQRRCSPPRDASPLHGQAALLGAAALFRYSLPLPRRSYALPQPFLAKYRSAVALLFIAVAYFALPIIDMPMRSFALPKHCPAILSQAAAPLCMSILCKAIAYDALPCHASAARHRAIPLRSNTGPCYCIGEYRHATPLRNR